MSILPLTFPAGQWQLSKPFLHGVLSKLQRLRLFLCQNKKKVHFVESYKDLNALGRKGFVGQRVRSGFWWLFEGSDLQLHHWPGVGSSP